MYPHRYAEARHWAPLTAEELKALLPFFARQGGGRPIFDIRARLDAVFWVVTSPHPWRCLPAAMGPADTASRQFRRWAHAGVWTRLLQAVADPKCPPMLRRLEHWICRAYRRGLRILKLAGIVIARRLGMCSAVNGPFWMLPDPDLSKSLGPLISRLINLNFGPGGSRDVRVLRLGQTYHRMVGGRVHIPKYLAPP